VPCIATDAPIRASLVSASKTFPFIRPVWAKIPVPMPRKNKLRKIFFYLPQKQFFSFIFAAKLVSEYYKVVTPKLIGS